MKKMGHHRPLDFKHHKADVALSNTNVTHRYRFGALAQHLHHAAKVYGVLVQVIAPRFARGVSPTYSPRLLINNTPNTPYSISASNASIGLGCGSLLYTGLSTEFYLCNIRMGVRAV